MTQSTRITSKVERFDLLDGIRGIAAIAVMIFHYSQHNGLRWIPGAWVAVDLFFVLSGFVISHSYGRKIADGMSLRRFALIRLIRLGPLYIAGLVLGIVSILATSLSISQLYIPIALGVFLVPYFNNASWPFGGDFSRGSIFPFNDPAWSLFFELFVNIVFFFYVVKYRKLSNCGIVIAAYFVFIFCTIITHQTNPGWSGDDFVLGFPRVVASFFLGSLIYVTSRNSSMNFALVLTCLSFAVFFVDSPKIAYLNSLVLVPLVVMSASSINISNTYAKIICKKLGEISYPIYIIHFPLYRLLHPVFEEYGPTMQVIIAGLIVSLMCVPLVRIDEYIRMVLMSKLEID